MPGTSESTCTASRSNPHHPQWLQKGSIPFVGSTLFNLKPHDVQAIVAKVMSGYKAHVTNWDGLRCFPFLAHEECTAVEQDKLTVIVRRFAETKNYDYVELDSAHTGSKIIAFTSNANLGQIHHWLGLLGWSRS